jgi:serine protease Do
MKFAMMIGLCALSGLAQTPRVVVMGGTYIGVAMQEHADGGVEITVVEPESPAEKAGLKVGDVVLRYNGQKVEGNEQFARLVRETPAGREAKIDINRAGAPLSVTVRVAQRKPRMEWNDGVTMGAPLGMPGSFSIPLPDLARTFTTLRSATLGVEAESIDGQLAQYFGVKEGVLVRSVLKGSAADKAGVKAGDVILKIDDAHVASPADISGQLRSQRGKAVPILVMRDHKEVAMTVTVTVSDDDPGGRIQITPYEAHPQPNPPPAKQP